MKVTDITTDAKFPKFSATGRNGKTVTITSYAPRWQLKYPNGMIKNFDEYHEVVTYLEQRGY